MPKEIYFLPFQSPSLSLLLFKKPSFYQAPDSLLSTEDISVNKIITQIPALKEMIFQLGRYDIKLKAKPMTWEAWYAALKISMRQASPP